MHVELYNQLAEEEEHSAVNSILQDLMEQELLDSGMMEELALDVGQTRKRFRDPVLTMEARHQQVCLQNVSQILRFQKRCECRGLGSCGTANSTE